jgi:hypothetical protein
LKTTENPREFYDSLDYHKKRKYQGLLFLEGLLFSLEKKQNLTSKTSILFELTNCYLDNYAIEKERTHRQKANESVYVPEAGVEPARFPTGV